MPERAYTAEQVDAAVERLTDPDRLEHAQEVVAHAAPALQRILGEALAAGGYFGNVHQSEVQRVASVESLEERTVAMETLIAEETRLGMFVGVAVGFELARELAKGDPQT